MVEKQRKAKCWCLGMNQGGGTDWTSGHCILHLLELAEKKIPVAIKKIFNELVKNINFIELRLTSTHLLPSLCAEMGAARKALTSHPEGRCSSQGNATVIL